MKEATGELSMTVVTIVAIVALLAIVSTFLMPNVRTYITNKWNEMSNTDATK